MRTSNNHNPNANSEGHSPFNVTNASTEIAEAEVGSSICAIHDILVKESPCTRVASVKSTHNSSVSVQGVGGSGLSK